MPVANSSSKPLNKLIQNLGKIKRKYCIGYLNINGILNWFI